MKNGSGSAPGKIILMGEHSVVYGKLAIALPFFSVGVKCTVLPIKGEIELESICYQGILTHAPEPVSGLKKLIEVTLDFLNKEHKDIRILIESTIPPQRGLGSSAAVSVALVRGLFDAFEADLSFDTLNNLVSVAESIHHTNPSGLDAITILNERFVSFEKDKGIEFFNASLKGYLVVADSGHQGQTKLSVQSVEQKLKTHPKETVALIDQLGDLADHSKDCISQGDMKKLGTQMTKAHFLLKDLGVSDVHLDQLVDAAHLAGALGAKLTGGGRGGCIIALCGSMVDAKKISDALIHKGAEQTWLYHLREVVTHG